MYFAGAAQIGYVFNGRSISSVPFVPIILIRVFTPVTFSFSDPCLELINNLLVVDSLAVEHALIFVHFIFMIIPESFDFTV
jgi:hypothetical protein